MDPELPFKPGRVEIARTLLQSDWLFLLFIFFKCTLMGFQGQSVQASTIVEKMQQNKMLYIKDVRSCQY